MRVRFDTCVCSYIPPFVRTSSVDVRPCASIPCLSVCVCVCVCEFECEQVGVDLINQRGTREEREKNVIVGQPINNNNNNNNNNVSAGGMGTEGSEHLTSVLHNHTGSHPRG